MPSFRRKLLTVTACVLAGVALSVAYLRLARAVTVNSDGASNALQAWDMFHGNPLLRGWTLSDVSFYPTELVQYGLVQLVTGVTTDQIHVAAAITWALVVVLAAWLAQSVAGRGPLGDQPGPAGVDTDRRQGRAGHGSRSRPGWRSPGRSVRSWLPAAVAVAILLVPAPGLGYQTLLSSPNHTGSAALLLVAWLLVDRARHRAWMPVAVGAVLAWGAVGDPLITFVGAVPLMVVSAWRALRGREWRGVDARLAVAGAASVAVSHAAIWLIERVGGFHAPRPPISLSPVSEWAGRAAIVARMIGVLFEVTRPRPDEMPVVAPVVQSPWVRDVLQTVHVPGLVLAAVALSLTVVAVVRGTADRVDAILAVAVVCDLGAEIVSTLPIDLLATREVVPALPMAAVLAARIAGRRLLQPRYAAQAPPAGKAAAADGTAVTTTSRSARIGGRLAVGGGWLLVVVLVVQVVNLAGYVPPRAEPIEGQEAADWLDGQGLRYGLGSYWVSNNITVGTSRRVTVVPVLSGRGHLTGMCWQTHTDMYDGSAHDARFVLLEKERPMYGTTADVLTQFGAPVLRRDFDKYVIFVYDRNLLGGFTTTC